MEGAGCTLSLILFWALTILRVMRRRGEYLLLNPYWTCYGFGDFSSQGTGGALPFWPDGRPCRGDGGLSEETQITPYNITCTGNMAK
ncbi:hypothetical protein Pelo_18215 [Pelomyxa schiedti]|nr:hypothetical protein Pelo_18215 [Pelomyxa schiedti]